MIHDYGGLLRAGGLAEDGWNGLVGEERAKKRKEAFRILHPELDNLSIRLDKITGGNPYYNEWMVYCWLGGRLSDTVDWIGTEPQFIDLGLERHLANTRNVDCYPTSSTYWLLVQRRGN